MPDNPQMVVQFVKRDDTPVYAATGIWGGFASNGSVVAHFFVESRANPATLTYEATPNGVVEVGRGGGDSDQDGRPIFVREVQCTVVVRPEDARSIGKWFAEKADLLEAAAKSGVPAR